MTAEAARLYGLPLEDFVRERNETAARLRKEGRREEAEEVRQLPKPTAPAWAANQLVRRHPDDVTALIEAAGRLRAAQEAAVSGRDSAGFAAARREHDAVLRRLGEAVDASGVDRTRVVGLLRAAAASDKERELLREGRLTREVEATGFEAFAGVPPRRAAREKPKAKPPPRRELVAAAQAEVKRAREEHRRLAQEAKEAARRAAEAEAALRAAEQALEEARAS